MADLFSRNRNLFIKKYERDKLVALSQIQSHEIRIIELEEEIERCHKSVDAQKKVLEELEKNIKLQHQEIEKEAN
jgi:septal ring factor EnvC (AmiA/AmiB activator)